MNIVGLLDLAQSRCKTKGGQPCNGSQLAKVLGVTRAAVSHWRRGQRFPDWNACGRLAAATGLDLATVVQIVAEAREALPGGGVENGDPDQGELPGFNLASLAAA